MKCLAHSVQSQRFCSRGSISSCPLQRLGQSITVARACYRPAEPGYPASYDTVGRDSRPDSTYHVAGCIYWIPYSAGRLGWMASLVLEPPCLFIGHCLSDVCWRDSQNLRCLRIVGHDGSDDSRQSEVGV